MGKNTSFWPNILHTKGIWKTGAVLWQLRFRWKP